MSAFVVDDNHINIIVSYFVTPLMQNRLWLELGGKYLYMAYGDAHKVAECLYSQNIRSVNERYNETEEDGFAYRYIEAAQNYSPGEIAMALDGLEYQSCETDDYHDTDAYKILLSMRKRLLTNMYEDEGADTWSITNVRKGRY